MLYLKQINSMLITQREVGIVYPIGKQLLTCGLRGLETADDEMLCLLWEGFFDIDLSQICIQVRGQGRESPLVLLLYLYAPFQREKSKYSERR